MVTQDKRLELKVGVPVEALDDQVGHLSQVILNPGDGRVTALVVRRDGLPPRDYVIPVEFVEQASDDAIRLKLTKEEAQAQPLLHRNRYLAPASGAHGYPSGQVLFSLLGRQGHRGGGPEEVAEGTTDSPAAAIRAGQRVVATDGDVGRVDRVLVDSATKRATHFTVHKGLLLRKDIMVPVEWIAEIRPDLIKLAVEKAALEHLPTYQPDQELQWAVEDALWSDHRLVDEVFTLYPIHVSVHDGVVTLRGNVRNAAQKRHVLKLVSGVPGVLSVNNHVVADDELEQAITQALAADPRTRGAQIRVYSWLGNVHLDGEVPTNEARSAAEQVAAAMPGVRGVVNFLSVEGVPALVEVERLRDLTTGQPVYARHPSADDGQTLVGQVDKLILDPGTWRVRGIIVKTRSGDGDGSASQPRDAGMIAVPIERVDRVTLGGVYLSLTEQEIARLPRLDAKVYHAPDRDWQPPTPYRREDIVLDFAHHLAAR
jgi:osmotically-inducible protein OsmY/uncharacterized protein YrrD